MLRHQLTEARLEIQTVPSAALVLDGMGVVSQATFTVKKIGSTSRGLALHTLSSVMLLWR